MVVLEFTPPEGHREICMLLFGAEYARASGEVKRGLIVVEGGQERQELSFKDVACSRCGQVLEALDVCAATPQHLYCQDCFKSEVLPYVTTRGGALVVDCV